MRQRLIRATLDTLVSAGYAGTTVSAIVRRAGVSRGAQLHHFPNKDSLILEATEYLMRRAYRILGELLLGVVEEENRLEALLETSWKEIYGTKMFAAYFELIVASQRDPALARALRDLTIRTQRRLIAAIPHYFEPKGESSESPYDMFALLHLVMGGLSATQHVMDDPEPIRRQLGVWTRLMATQMRAKRGVKAPPPRPPDWDQWVG
ncbi:MAG TPA: TetR/AcrR family transcriptional regulator [Nevskiaceae bacterium]|nr:TetR/AcrR family transcriptional regulator [Nevskiaceae bacterium]